MKIRDFMAKNVVCLDGGLGTLLQSKGLFDSPEKYNISHAQDIIAIHKSYYDAGADIVSTNTFSATALKYSDDELESIIPSAVSNVMRARELNTDNRPKYVALDVGPLGKLLKPYGDLDFEDAVKAFSKVISIGAKCGVDLIFIETFTDCYETKAALLASKESCDLPVFVSNAYEENGKLLTGATPEAMAIMLESMGADAIGANCSFGPEKLAKVVEKIKNACSLPVILEPNADLPIVKNGKTIYGITPSTFASIVADEVKNGIRIVGGCCGTTPEYICALKDKIKGIKPVKILKKHITAVTSYSKCVCFGNKPIIIGERINPTGKKRLKEALINKDLGYILEEGFKQKECGADILDVNAGLPGIDEKEMLTLLTKELQAVNDLPLQLDTSNIPALESALRIYNGKALINSVNGKQESMQQVLPLVKKYGGVVVALTLDENGIPSTVDGRIEIAKRILENGKKYGLTKDDFIFDALTMTVSADKDAALLTIETTEKLSQMGLKTSLGVSNVSFGLPDRETLNAVFFNCALEKGLSAAILNPYSQKMMATYYAFNALHGKDDNCMDYIAYADKMAGVEIKPQVATDNLTLKDCIERGFKDKAGEKTKQLLESVSALDIINNEIIPALDEVGKKFEKKVIYLPQLLISAESAKCAFNQIASVAKVDNNNKKCKIVLATVKGDVHDIGKNIVKLLLENYGYDVIDLGKDVATETILNAVIDNNAPILGLSALMTTTVVNMQATIELVKQNAPWCKIVVGGAVLNKEYAMSIGADAYSKDAMETVRFAETLI